MNLRTMVCVECGARLEKTTPGKARKIGWILWDGGGRCAGCERRRDLAEAEFTARLTPTVSERRKALVICASCSKQLEGNEVRPGVFWPTFHWLTTDENKRLLREKKKPIPLCPGYKQPAKLVETDGASA